MLLIPFFVLSFWLTAAGDSSPAGTQPAPQTAPAPPAEDEIRRIVKQLNHPSLSRRRAAIRQLAEWGPLAFPELRRAAGGANLEEALSARDLLRELESAILIGAHVRLELDGAEVRWDEPFALRVHAHNPTAAAIRVPWPEVSAEAAAGDEHVRQVTGMLDAADFLTVSGPDGEPLDLRVEPIDRDPVVHREVSVRAGDQPPSHLIPPGASERLDIPLFNRGWARYPMLAAGTYTIAFAYQPQWREESWTEDGFGLVRSQPVTVEITEGAPESIQRSHRPLELRVRRSGEMLIAEVCSTWDIPLWVNLNFGDDITTHARLTWTFGPPAEDCEPRDLHAEETALAFQPDRLLLVEPDQTLAISRISVDKLRARAREEGLADEALLVGARYLHLSSSHKIRERLAELGQEAPREGDPGLPFHLFSGVVSSEQLPVAPPRR